MGNADIILTRVKQRRCPVCTVEVKPEWRDKYKPVQYKGQALLICKEHFIDGEQFKEVNIMEWNAIIQEVARREGGKKQADISTVSEVISNYNKLIMEKTSIDILEVMKKTK